MAFPRTFDVMFTVTQSEDACIVTLSRDGRILAEGTSRRMPEDPVNSSAGRAIAARKALQALMDKNPASGWSSDFH